MKRLKLGSEIKAGRRERGRRGGFFFGLLVKEQKASEAEDGFISSCAEEEVVQKSS